MEIQFVEAEEIFIPSVSSISATYESLDSSVKRISEESSSVLDTVNLVSDILNKITGSGDNQGIFDNLGLIAIPIPVAMKAVFMALNNYVEQKTGVSLKSWTSFVNSTRAEFESYLKQLETVAEQASSTKKLLESESTLTEDVLLSSRDLLEKTRVKTLIWKPVMAQTSKLNNLVESMLAAKEQIGEETQEEAGKSGPLPRNLIKKVGDSVKDLTSGEQPKVLDFLSDRINDLKSRIGRLNDQINSLSGFIVELEDLLELEIAQIKAMLGEIPPDEARVLGTRVAASVLIPRLREQFLQTERKINQYQSFLQRLHTANEAGEVSEAIYQNLSVEYQGKLEKIIAELNLHKQEAKTWKKQRAPALDFGLKWLQEELDTVKIRELVGELPESLAEKRRRALEREIERFSKANQLLNSQSW